MTRDSLHNRINVNQVADRLDSEYYTKELLENEATLGRFGQSTLSELVDDSKQNNIADLTSNGSFEFLRGIQFNERGGIPFIRTQNLMDGYVDDSDIIYVNQECRSMVAKSICATGDLIVCRKGKVGAASAVPGRMDGAAISENITRFSLRAADDGDFLAAFFNSSQGRKRFMREATGVIQKWINTEKLRDIKVIRLNAWAERYIGDKVRQAERLRDLSRSIECRLRDIFTPLTDGLPKSPKAWRASSQLLDPYRVNPSHYDPVVLRMVQDARTKVKLVELGCIVGDRGISGGATPLGADYRDSGVFFVRVQNVKPYRLDLSDAAYLSAHQDQQLARSRCGADDIIYSITGYPGTASLVMEEDLPVNLNQHCVRFDVRPPYEAAYVAAAMNSPFVKRQVDRLAIGGTREALDYPSVRSLLIPMLDEAVMLEVGKHVRKLNRAERLSQRLVVAARLLTEAVIEGKIAEAELIQIQNSIENGSRSADRDLLQRLTANGIDVADEPRLLPDLDALYRILLESTTEPERSK